MEQRPQNYLPGIKCEVKNCKYNNAHCCTAEEIRVAPQHACCAADTACATFKPAE